MSLLEKLCEELGVKVGEEWLGSDGKHYYIDNHGYLVNKTKEGYTCTDYIERVLSGELKPIWEPKPNEKYYVPSVYAPEKYMHSTWEYTPRDRLTHERGIIFKTREEAIEMTNKMLQLAKEEV